MIDQTIAITIFIGLVLNIIGLNMISSSSYSVPPVPAGWAIGVVFTDVGAALALSGAIVVKLFKVRQRLWTVVGILGLCIVGLGVRNIILSPLELPACPCLPGYY